MCPWASPLTSLNLTVLTCNVGETLVLLPEVTWESGEKRN